MIFNTTKQASEVMGGLDILSLTGLIILTIGIVFTVGVPLIMILKRKKEKVIFSENLSINKIC